jgi:hypothetical protein
MTTYLSLNRRYTPAIPFGPGELKKENNSVYYFRERISLYSCDIVERRTNLMVSTSHGTLPKKEEN